MPQSVLCPFCGRTVPIDVRAALVGPDGTASGFLHNLVAAGIWSRACVACMGKGASYFSQLRELYLFERTHSLPGTNIAEMPGYPVTHPELRAEIARSDEAARQVMVGRSRRNKQAGCKTSRKTRTLFLEFVRFGIHRFTVGDRVGLPVQVPLVHLRADQEVLFRRSKDIVDWLPFIYSRAAVMDGVEVIEWAETTLSRLEAAAFLGERYRSVSDRLASDPSFATCLIPDPMSPNETVFDFLKLIAWVRKNRSTKS